MKGSNKRWLSRWLIIPLYLLLLGFTALGLSAPWLPVTSLPEAQLLAPLVPVFALLHLGFVLGFRRRARLWLVVSLAALAATGYVALRDLAWRPQLPPETAQLSLVSYNVATFDYNPDNIEEVARLLAEVQPDVIALQEFRNQELANGRKALDFLAERLGMPHASFIHLPIHIHGTATFSRFPIIGVDTLFLPRREINSGILLTLDSPAGPIGVANMHLSSFNLGRILAADSTWQGRAWQFRRNAIRVLQLQQEKVDLVMTKTAGFPHPLILAGDLNATPHSRITRPFFARFRDSFASRGRGWGWSFPVWGPTGIRIDYQFYSAGLEPIAHQVIRSDISDHYPLLVRYRQAP